MSFFNKMIKINDFMCFNFFFSKTSINHNQITTKFIILKIKVPLDSHCELQFAKPEKVQNLRKTT